MLRKKGIRGEHLFAPLGATGTNSRVARPGVLHGENRFDVNLRLRRP